MGICGGKPLSEEHTDTFGLCIAMGCCGREERERQLRRHGHAGGAEFDPVVAQGVDSKRGVTPDDVRTLTIPCEPSHVGSVIGHHGSTIKDVEARSGARIRVDKTTAPERPAIIASGSPAAVTMARQLLEALLDELDHPDYEGEAGQKLRKEAEKWGDKMHQLFDAAHAAHEAHDGKRAKELSNQGKAAQAQRDKANKAAAAAIFKHRNPGANTLRCDLHGLHKDEALAALESYFGEIGAVASGTRIAIVIPGAGRHSAQHQAVLKPAVESWLRSRHFSYKAHDTSGGSLEVKV